MTPTRHTGSPLAAGILRGVLLQGQPHVLSRPNRHLGPAALRLRQAEPEHPTPGAVAASDALTADVAYEAGLANGRQQAADAVAAAAAEDVREREAALAALRVTVTAEARLEGLAQGREEALAATAQAQAQAMQQADEAAADSLQRFDQLLESLITERARRLEEAEEDLVALSHETVCRILGPEAVRPERIRSMVLHLLAQYGQRSQLAVHIHPDDFDAVSKQRGQSRATPWRWVGDTAVQLGGVVLRSPEGGLDARLETQLAALRDALVGTRRARKEAALHEIPATGSSGEAA